MAITPTVRELKPIIDEAKRVAREYRDLTGKPLGITGEVGEFYAAELLGLQLAEVRCPGHGAVGPDGRRVQIKARCLPDPKRRDGRVSQIKFDHAWDTVALVLMDLDFEPLAVYETRREDVKKAFEAPGSIARNVRGALSLRKFIAISRCAWRSSEST